MKLQKKFLVGFFLCSTVAFLVVSANPTDNIDLLWKARSLQAIEKLDKWLDDRIQADNLKEAGFSEKEIGNYLDSKFTPKIKQELLMELAYALILKEPEACIKESEEGRSYHLLFNCGDDGALDIFYTYNTITQKLLGSGIDRLPKGYRVFFHQSLGDSFLIMPMDDPNQPSMIFSSVDPFENLVIVE